ncbi:MAG: DUF1059 domain-containing protein [Candidatus Marsarchaeota archaeon]|nr:DUF1059 domain-containing protein [Candidatus Marsarchaeota archaeon]
MNGYKVDLKEVCGCSVQVSGQSKDELIGNVVTHAKNMHNLSQVPPELAQKLMKAIKEA